MSALTSFDPVSHSVANVVAALLATDARIQVVDSSIAIQYGECLDGTSSIAFYDGTLPNLGIGPGVLISSGTAEPPNSNTSSHYSAELTPSNLDSDLDQVIHAIFPSAGPIYDVTSIAFQFYVSDTALKNIQFDLIFGSDEYPEYSDTEFVDIAAVFVNGVNYAFFNQAPDQPLSILDKNLNVGNFIDNQESILPLEYDGISSKLTIVAPVQAGLNTIKFAIADTGDQIYDSGLFISNLRAVPYGGSGLAQVINLPEQPGVIFWGHEYSEHFEGTEAGDIVFPGLGNDVLVGGGGIDVVAYLGSIDDFTITTDGDSHVLQGMGMQDTLYQVERIYFDQSGLFALDTRPGQNTWLALALFNALLDGPPSTAMLSQWLAVLDHSPGLGSVAQQILDQYAPGVSASDVVSHLWRTVGGIEPSPSQVSDTLSLFGTSFTNLGEFVAAVSLLDINTQEIASVVGLPVALDVSFFV